MPDWSHEIAAGLRKGRIVCGIDEVGRGPLAGPVLAGAVVLDPARLPAALAARLDDSKKLTAAAREDIAAELHIHAVFALGLASVAEIDELNIYHAAHLAMRRAFAALPVRPDHALIDGNRAPRLPCRVTTIVGGDGKSLAIAPASILAKVARDKIMRSLAERYSRYGWERNAGYGTAEHRAAIDLYGITPEHRRSFGVVSQLSLLTD